MNYKRGPMIPFKPHNFFYASGLCRNLKKEITIRLGSAEILPKLLVIFLVSCELPC